MIERKVKRPPEFAYPIDEWKMVETQFYRRLVPQAETMFAIGNGYLGMRGNFEEGRPVHQPGTFVNGFHETWPIVYGEDAYGFARTGQTMLSVPEGKTIELEVDGETFMMPEVDIVESRRWLDMRAGLLERRVVWRTSRGNRIRLETTRVVSFHSRHVAAVSYQVTPLDADAQVVVRSRLVRFRRGDDAKTDPRKAHRFPESPLLLEDVRFEGTRIVAAYTTRDSRMGLACGFDHSVDAAGQYMTSVTGPEPDGIDFTFDTSAGEAITIIKYIGYVTDTAPDTIPLQERLRTTLDDALITGFATLVAEQRTALDDFWSVADIEITESADNVLPSGSLQQAIRWNLFQLFQAACRVAGTGIPAKGLTGQAYEGHYFWDTEVYVLPFLVYTAPQTARNLLEFRHRLLGKARDRAAEIHLAGALFPWRTINGEEASAYFAAGTAQFHIDAAIAYALEKYVAATGDEDFLAAIGTEILVETARMWADLGFYSDQLNGEFCINGVTGPDEYTALVDNNCYTNMMARRNLRFAADTVEWLRTTRPDDHTDLVAATGLGDDEPTAWRKAADQMHIPVDEATGLHLQDSRALVREPWDFENTPLENYPLLLHYHPLTIYRHQVLKQVDLVLATFLLGDEFTAEQKRMIFEFYDPITTGDSSLSASIESIMATEIGNMEAAMDYGTRALLLDIANLNQNVADGCHIAAIGGAWMVLVQGFGGMRDHGGRLSFRPRLPAAISALSFPVTVRGQTVDVAVTAKDASYRLRSGEPLTITHWDEPLKLVAGEATTLPVPPLAP